MKEKLQKIVRGKAHEILILLICALIFCFFISQKEGFHMDELLSFELANAEFNPWIVTTQPQGRLAKFVHNEIDGENFGETVKNLVAVIQDVIQNRGDSKLLSYKADVYEEPVWISGEQFAEYILVDGKDAFNYFSVYFNVKDDNHPPLHFMLLHTVSSLFQNKISPWMGCVINLAAVLCVQMLLWKLGDMLAWDLGLGDPGRKTGMMAALFYGLSTGAVATVLLIRMYGMVTLWCVLYFYLILKKWRETSFDKKNAGLIVVTMLGFWTQYFFLFYCLCLAFVVVVCLAKNKRVKELTGFIRSMAVAAAIGLAVFPFAISDVFSSERGVEALGNLAVGLAGYGTRLKSFGQILAGREISGHVLIIPALLASFVANGLWKKKSAGRADGAGRTDGTDRTGHGEVLWMLLFPPVGYFLLAARMSPYLVDRYLMPLFPFAALVLMLTVFGLIAKLRQLYSEQQRKGLQWVVCCALILLQVGHLVCYDGSYLYRGYAEQKKTAAEYAGYPCICLYDGVGYYENLQEFACYDKSLLLTLEQLEERKDKESIAQLDEVLVLVKANVDPLKVLQILLSDDYGFHLEREVEYSPSAYGDMIFIVGKEHQN